MANGQDYSKVQPVKISMDGDLFPTFKELMEQNNPCSEAVSFFYNLPKLLPN